MSMHYTGKALIQVRYTGSKWVPFDVHITIMSKPEQPRDTKHYRYADVGEVVQESLSMLETESHRAPTCMERMKPGDRLTFTCRYDVWFTQDYWGEVDEHLELTKVRVIKRIPWKKKRNKR